MKFNRGMITDVAPIDQIEGSWRDAKNIVHNKYLGAIANEPGFELKATISDGRTIVGRIPVDNDQTILFICTPESAGGGSEIARLDGSTVGTIIKDDALGLLGTTTIKGTWWRNFKGELIIAWVDNINPPRILNIDNPGISLTATKAFSDVTLVHLLKLNPNYSTPAVAMKIEAGGSLQSGSYYVAMAYELADGTITDYSRIHGPLAITDDSIGEDWSDFDGANAGTLTGNSIGMTFTGLDDRYQWLRIFVIKKIRGTIEAAYVARIYIDATTKAYTYTGNEDISPVTLEDIVTDNLDFTRAKTITQYNNKLYLANFGLKDNDIGYQPYANGIVTGWVWDTSVSLTDVKESYKNGEVALSLRGWMPGEVYDLYIAFVLDNGQYTPAYHIPGVRAPQITRTFFNDDESNSIELTFSADATIRSLMDEIEAFDANYNQYPVWRFFSSIIETDEDIRFFHVFDTWQSDPNRLGFWENQDETYPDTDDYDIKDVNGLVIDNIRGEKVRHHRIPTLSSMLEHTGEKWINKEVIANNALHVEKILSTSNAPDSVSTSFTTLSDPGENIGSYRSTSVIDTPATGTTKEYRIRYNALQSHRVGISGDILLDLHLDQSEDLYAEISIKHYDFSGVLLDTIYSNSNEGDLQAKIWETIGSFFVDMDANDYIEIRWFYSAQEGINNPLFNVYTDINLNISGYPAGSAVTPVINDWRGKIMGIKVSNIVVPKHISEQTIGFEIFYAKRTANNMTVAGQSMFFFGADHPVNEGNIGSNAGNIRQFVIENNNGTVNTSYGSMHDDVLRMHPFDMLNENIAVSPSFVKPQVVMNGLYKRGWDHKEGRKTQIKINDDSGVVEPLDEQHITFLLDFMQDLDGENVSDPVDQFTFSRKVKNWQYLPANTFAVNHDNTHSEECVFIELDHKKDRGSGKMAPYGYNPITLNSGYNTWNEDEVNLDEGLPHWIGDICIHRRNVYRPFASQELVSTGIFQPVILKGFSFTASVDRCYGGDTFLSLYSLRLTCGYRKEKPENTIEYVSLYNNQSVVTVVQFPCYSVANIGLRHQDDSGDGSYYPNSTGAIPLGNTSNAVWRKANDALFWKDVDNDDQIVYNEDYSSVNDLNTCFPFDTFAEFLADYPYQIVRSKDYRPDSKENTQRVFLPNDYYEMPHNRGAITNIEVLAERLLIHHQYSIFMTVSKDTLQTDAGLIALGSGDLFRLPPNELLTADNGYAGLQHLSGALLCKLGYAFVDAEMGKVFLLTHGSGEPIEVSKQGLRNDLERKIKGYYGGYPDAPWLAGGFAMLYDEKHNRIVMSVKRIDENFTISFTPDLNAWLSYHDYLPTISWNTRNKVFHVDNNMVYEGNASSFAKFFGEVIYPSYINYVVNPRPDMTKVFKSIQWVSEIKGDYSNIHKTITDIAAYNRYQATGWIELARLNNIRSAEGTWKFNELRDISQVNVAFLDDNGDFINLNPGMAWHEKKRMVDKYLQVIMKYDNADQLQLLLYEVDALLAPSSR